MTDTNLETDLTAEAKLEQFEHHVRIAERSPHDINNLEQALLLILNSENFAVCDVEDWAQKILRINQTNTLAWEAINQARKEEGNPFKDVLLP